MSEMNHRSVRQGLQVLAQGFQNLGLNGRMAMQDARWLRDLLLDALLRGEPVAVPGLDLQLVWDSISRNSVRCRAAA